jgi:hypothetical protein
LYLKKEKKRKGKKKGKGKKKQIILKKPGRA